MCVGYWKCDGNVVFSLILSCPSPPLPHIDTDGNDCDIIAHALRQGFLPKIIHLEIAPNFPPPLTFNWHQAGLPCHCHQHYHYPADIQLPQAWSPSSTNQQGSAYIAMCSLSYATDMLERFGYALLQVLHDVWL